MKKVSFRRIIIDVEGKDRSFWVLETPTLLKELLNKKIIDKELYLEKLNTYEKAIELKELEVEPTGRLRDYQEQNVNYAKEFKSFAIFSEPRLGKTPTTISLLKEKDLINEKIIVMSPGSVIGNWIKAFKEWGNVKAEKYNGGEINTNVIITTYQRAALSINDIIKWNPKVAILDEAHVLRNSKGKRQAHRYTEKQELERKEIEQLKQYKRVGRSLTIEELEKIKNYSPPITANKAILKISSKAEHRYALSGTPNVNKPEDIFAILQFIYPKFFDSYWTFVYYYFKVNKNYFGARVIKGISGEEKQKEIQELLNYISTRDTQKEKMTWLKPPKIKYTYLEMSEEQKKLEHELINEGRINDTFILNTLEQMTNYNTLMLSPKLSKYTDSNDNGTKIEYILDYIMDYPEKNIAIFSTRNQFLTLIKKEIEKEFPYKEIYLLGKKNSLEIQTIINKKSIKRDIIFLGTIGKSKEGISLVGINKAFIVDQSWVPSDIEQIIHRLDATTPEEQEYFGEKEFEILQFEGSIDTIIQEGLDQKESRTKIINNYQEFVKRRKNNAN